MALEQYYFWNRHAVEFFGGFITKTNRYAAAFLSRGPPISLKMPYFIKITLNMAIIIIMG